MSETLAAIWTSLGPVGGIAGIISLVLTLYYRRTAHRILLARYEREEQARDVDACVDDLRRRADVIANNSGSPVTMLRVSVDLTSELDFKAAYKLARTGEASLEGSRLHFVINRVPKAIQQDMERRGR